VPLAVFLVLLLVLFSAWFSGLISSPVKKLSWAMLQVDRNISNQKLQLHTSVPELKELVNSYNELLSRMRNSLIQAQRFSADAAHELKTPLTILQGRIESAVAVTSDISVQQLLASLQAEVSHLTSITRKLLLLSQADAGNLRLDKKEFDWSALVSSSLNDSHDLFESLQVEASIEPSLRVFGDACLFTRLINNLLCNISKYAVSDAPVHISSAQVSGWVETRFRNRSRPMSVAQRSCLFDRFYRVGGEFSESNAGAGLGLSLAREIARAHGGDLVLEETAEDVFEFKLTLPAVQSAD
jgi:signal transduction histidine kinase